MPSVLIVDDSPTIRYITSHALQDSGYEVLTANDGASAVELAAEHLPDAILLDVILPKLNGFHVCRQIRANAQTRHIPIVMITSKDKEPDRDWGMEQGADVYITKPVDQQELLATLESLLEAKQHG
ncbi:MAG: response regulator [Chloroflexi bacterium]|nr:response regulator [Chloroflexota bacterium]